MFPVTQSGINRRFKSQANIYHNIDQKWMVHAFSLPDKVHLSPDSRVVAFQYQESQCFMSQINGYKCYENDMIVEAVR